MHSLSVMHNGGPDDTDESLDLSFGPDEKGHGGASRSTPAMLGTVRMVRLLGRGGMGEVWLGHDTSLDRPVAVKCMRRELAADERAIARFHREAKAVARLNHPNIVHIYTIGEESNLLYFSMEFVDGISLADRLAGGPIPYDAAKTILMQLVDALAHAHAGNVIHRDIKPGNIMFDRNGRVKLTDFGLAKTLGQDSQMTMAGVAMGSPNYMSPEQAKGEVTDHRSDIYSLGITFFQMLTGNLPHTASTPVSVLLKQVQDPLPEPAELQQILGGSVLNVLKRMTAKAPADRFQDYAELRAALCEADPTIGTSSAPELDRTITFPASAPVPPARPRQWLVWFALGVAAAAVVLTLLPSPENNADRTSQGAPTQQVAPTPTATPSASPTAMPAEPDAARRPRAENPMKPALRLLENIEDAAAVEQARLDNDFAAAAAAAERLLNNRRLLPERRQALKQMHQALMALAGWREKITREAAARSGKFKFQHPEAGPTTLESAKADAFVLRDAKNNPIELRWRDLAPDQVLGLAKQLLPDTEFQQVRKEFQTLHRAAQQMFPPRPRAGETARP